MWKRLSNWFYKFSTGWVTAAAVLVFILFSVLVLPGQSSSEDRGEELGSPDLSMYYPAEELYRMAEGYGEDGRAAYIQARFTFDLVWPMVYTFFLVATLSWIYQRVLLPGNPWRVINLLPVWGMLADYLENISTSIVMWRYPQVTPVIDWMAGFITAAKWLLISASFLALILGMVLIVWRFIRAGKASEN